MNISAGRLSTLDRVFDYIPVISTVTNLAALFCKKVLIPRSDISKNHYYTYLNNKTTFRCVVLLVPVIGNIAVFLLDMIKKQPIPESLAPKRVEDPPVIIERGNVAKAQKNIAEVIETEEIELSLNNLGLTTLPPTLWEMTRLAQLNLSGNKLTFLPKEIGLLTSLTSLKLSQNLLSSLPPEIGRLRDLKTLSLARNKLTSLPPEIGQLMSLTKLILSSNLKLKELPMNLGEIPSLTDIIIVGTRVPFAVRHAILRQCRLMINADVNKILPLRLTKWNTMAKSSGHLKITDLSNPQKKILNEWLLRLEKTKDFARLQSVIASKVCEILADLLNNDDFQKIFFPHAEANNECCQDRAAMSLNEIYTSWNILCKCVKMPLKEKMKLITGVAKTLRLRKELQFQINKHEREKNSSERESAEIFLYYETDLCKQLKLVTAIQNMTYNRVGKRDWIDEKRLIKKVEAHYFEDLYELPIFEKILLDDAVVKKQWDEIDSEFHHKLKQLGELPVGGAYDAQVLDYQHRQAEIMCEWRKRKVPIAKKWYEAFT